MKRYFVAILLALCAVFFVNAGDCEAGWGWRLYDDFDSGVIDPALWDIDNTSANFSVEDGKVKIEHLSGHPSDSAWLIFLKNPENIIGVRADLQIAQGTNDLRARLGGFLGVNESEELLWKDLTIRMDRAYLSGGIWNMITQIDYFWQRMGENIDPTGRTFTLEMNFRPELSTFTVMDMATAVFIPHTDIMPPDDTFKGIGTRSNSGDGEGVVYVDNVWVRYSD